MPASILAVDDSASMRQMVSFTLKGAGYEVVEAADGVEALNIAKGRPVNLVITEVVADTSPVKQDSMSEGEVELF